MRRRPSAVARYPVRSARDIRHDLVPAPLYRPVTAIPPEDTPSPLSWDRPVLETTLELADGRTLTLFNAHLRAPLAAPVAGQKEAPFAWKTTQGWAEGYFLAGVKRTGQALELRLAIDRVLDADPQALIAVCGDLNAEDHETALRIIAASEEDTGSGKLGARALVPLERSISQDRRYTVVHHGRPQMLDHILVSHSLLGHFADLEIHNEALGDEMVGYTGVSAPPDSYHAPVVANLLLE